MKVRVRPKIGDVIEVETTKGLAYLQYTANHTDYGQLVRVLPGLYSSRPSDISALTQKKELYFVFTPIGVACRRKEAVIVSNEIVPDGAEGIPLMRRRTAFAPMQKHLTGICGMVENLGFRVDHAISSVTYL